MKFKEKLILEEEADKKFRLATDAAWRKYEEVWKPLREEYEASILPHWKEYYKEMCKIQDRWNLEKED
jgi:hypothetical protein